MFKDEETRFLVFMFVIGALTLLGCLFMVTSCERHRIDVEATIEKRKTATPE